MLTFQYWRLRETSDDGDEKRSRETTGDYHSAFPPHRIRRKSTLWLLMACVCFITLLFIGTASYRYRARSEEWLPTNFHNSEDAGNSIDALLSFTLPDAPIRSFDGLDIGAHYRFSKQLSGGQEGLTSIYYDTQRGEDVVIKTFDTRYHPLRNFLPRSLLQVFGTKVDKWPTELPATLLMGGLERGRYWSRTLGASDSAVSKTQHNFLPVYDYFLMQSGGSSYWQWNLVTPLVHNGTLPRLATRIRASFLNSNNAIPSVSVLHDTYQAAFNRLLDMLSTLHSQGLCHDDVKPANVFVIDDTHWILADLGAVRETQHLLHRSFAWLHLQQWPDCRQNDVRRAIKVYLSLLREATTGADGSTRAFDEQFMAGWESWASMYWNYIADLARDEFHVHDPAAGTRAATSLIGAEPGRWVLARWIWTEDQIRAYVVSQELHTSLMDSWGLWMLRDWLLLGSWRKERPVSRPL